MKLRSSSTRRQFLQRSGLAVAAPFILPSSIWAAEGNETPNNRIVVGFIGMGTQNRGHLGGFMRRKEVQVVAVCDVDTTRRENARKRVEDTYAKATDKGTWKGCTAYNDFRELIARKDIDAVVVATPDHWHGIITVAAAGSGKDIYCEKPLSLTIHEAQAMVQAARQNKRVFQTGSQQRSSSEFLTACELVQNGAIGKISHVDVAVGASSKWCDLPEQAMEPGLDWNFWLGPAPMRGYNEVLSPRGVHDHFPNWRNYREYSGGMMTDWGAHHFDIAQWGLGMDGSGPVDIIPPEDPKSDYGVKYIYTNGVELNHVSNGFGVTFHGADGKVNVNRGKFELYLGGERKAANPKEGEQVAATLLPAQAKRLYKSRDHAGDFLACMRSRQKPICDVAIGASSVIVCHLGNLAYWNRRRLKWNPEKGEFVGDAEANTWRGRDLRQPWAI